MELESRGLALFIIWAPTLLAVIFLVGAGILYAKVRSPALAFFFFGALATTLIPWAFELVVGIDYPDAASSLRPLVMVLAFTVQVLGFLFYALSVPRRAPQQ